MNIQTTQRADYTFKYNRTSGRHGWLRLTPAYSVKLVEEILRDSVTKGIILDPFSGSGTTGLCAKEQGQEAYLFEINPFLVWLAKAKCRSYSEIAAAEILAAAKSALSIDVSEHDFEQYTPNMYQIERWWTKSAITALSKIRAGISLTFGAPGQSDVGDLLWVAFCRLVIDTSSAAFNHVSMSFKEMPTQQSILEIDDIYLSAVGFVASTLLLPSETPVHVLEQDSLQIRPIDFKASHVITSPPYPNRISYIRELRPYMYWTGFLQDSQAASELDWSAVGGTWGVATSRLASWEPSLQIPVSCLSKTVDTIERSDGRSSHLMAQYVHKYFHDMFLHLSSLKSVLEDNAKIDYILGNSYFFGVHVPTDMIITDMLHTIGYKNEKSTVIRKRNSKKGLFEFRIEART